MPMLNDAELLRDYSESRCEAAFAELVGRYLDFVYSAALRQVGGDAHLAQDVTQTVFVDLARKAKVLSKHKILTGWLYTSTRYAANKVVRTEQRRQAREQEAYLMQELLHQSGPEPAWDRLRPVLDDAMHELNERDRDAVLLRYFEGRALAEIGAKLGLSADAARMRVDRALDKLQVLLAKRGITSSTAALAAVLAGQTLTAAPTGMAASIVGTALASSATGTGTTITALKLMAMTKLQLGIIGGIAVVGVATTLLFQHRTRVELQAENQSLRRQTGQLAQATAENERLSKLIAEAKDLASQSAGQMAGSRVKASASRANAAADEKSLQRVRQMLHGETSPRLTTEQLESYLKENRRSAASLLAAFRATGDTNLLEEAMQKHPNDPQVNFAALFKKDASPEEHRLWLDSFKKLAPDNALPNYFSALDYLKGGQTDQAVQELTAAAGKEKFQDYSLEFVQNAQDAWSAAGYAGFEAKTTAMVSLLLPQLAEMKQLTQGIVELATSYRQAGDETSAQAALQMAVKLGQRFDADGPSGQMLINNLVGIAIQRSALGAMDPNSPYGDGGQTVKDQLDQLAQKDTGLKELTKQFEPLMASMSAQDLISYNDRMRAFGEIAAAHWLISKNEEK